MDELGKILELLNRLGWQPIAAAIGLLILLRVSEPKIVAGAVSRIYGDCRGAVVAYWHVREKYHEAELEAIRARARRDRAIEVAYHAHETAPEPPARSGSDQTSVGGVRRTGSGGLRLPPNTEAGRDGTGRNSVDRFVADRYADAAGNLPDSTDPYSSD